ncbi:MAG: protein arginine kinase [Planctomycetota bacterium]
MPSEPERRGGEWLREEGPESDIVMSSRIRLARNLEGFPFVLQATGDQKREIERIIRTRLMKAVFPEDGTYVDVEDLDDVGKQYLIERHLISRELAASEGKRGVAHAASEVSAVMVNEEDHLRMQVIRSGFELDRTWDEMVALDDAMEKELEFAFSPQFGYLTACPTNVGTGMRASVMLHLPALVMTKEIEKVFQAVSKINLAVRGLYGEGTQASGDFYQISNQVTLGRSESAVIDNIKRVVPRIIGYERNVRELLMTENRVSLEDKVFRAFGILRNARSIASEESTNLLSALRLGVTLGLVNDLGLDLVNELFVVTQPGHLQHAEQRELEARERDEQRATLIRGLLGAE